MDYIGTVAVEKDRRVIAENKGGASKRCRDWQGGGSFVYCELKMMLKNLNSKIQEAISTGELMNC